MVFSEILNHQLGNEGYRVSSWGKAGINGPYEGIYRVVTSMPFPLRSSNGFIGESENGWVIVDGGVNTELNRQVWDAALNEIGIHWRQVTAIYLTHYHHDHLGLAGWMQQQSEAPVFMSPQDAVMVDHLLLLSAPQYIDQFKQECSRHQWDTELLPLLAQDVAKISVLLNPLPQISRLTPEHTFLIGGHRSRLMATPGHTDGHLCFLTDNNLLFSGDNLLATNHLHATDWPHNRVSNPLYHFISAMTALDKLPIKTVLPGHGPVFNNFSERWQLLMEHHLARITRVWEELKHPMTAWELAQKVFPDAEYIHIKRLILAETLAYLELLKYCQLVGCQQQEFVTCYYPVDGVTLPSNIEDFQTCVFQDLRT